MLWLAAALSGLAVLALGRRDTGRLGRALTPRADAGAGALAFRSRSGSRSLWRSLWRSDLGLRPRPRPPPRVRVGPGRGAGSGARPVLASVAAGAAVALLLAPPAGLVVGLVVTVLGPQLLRRLEPAEVRARREQLVADLPLMLDLLASCLAGGAPLPEAARAVAAAVQGPAGERLTDVCLQLSVGTPPAQAWSGLTGSPDDPTRGREVDPLAPAARALGRAAEGGAPVADAVARLAEDARAHARAQGQQAARRVGVLVVAPLGLCFLPAFVLLGVVPIVAGLVGPLLATL